MSFNHKIGIGTVQFGIPYGISNKDGKTPDTEVVNILEFALNNGILVIDTASAYGNAEEVLGRNNLSSFKVVSKYMPSTERNDVERQLTKSLSKLNVDKIYGYLAHRPSDLLTHSEKWEHFKRLKDEGKVNKIGYSLNSVEELVMLLDKNMFPDLIQVPYNYFDNRFYDKLIELKSQGCEIHTRSVFLQGLFFMNVDKLPDFFSDVKWRIHKLQLELKDNLAGALLKYVLALDFIDYVIMGVENVQQLSFNLNSINEAPVIVGENSKISDLILMPVNWPKH